MPRRRPSAAGAGGRSARRARARLRPPGPQGRVRPTAEGVSQSSSGSSNRCRCSRRRHNRSSCRLPRLPRRAPCRRRPRQPLTPASSYSNAAAASSCRSRSPRRRRPPRPLRLDSFEFDFIVFPIRCFLAPQNHARACFARKAGGGRAAVRAVPTPALALLAALALFPRSPTIVCSPLAPNSPPEPLDSDSSANPPVHHDCSCGRARGRLSERHRRRGPRSRVENKTSPRLTSNRFLHRECLNASPSSNKHRLTRKTRVSTHPSKPSPHHDTRAPPSLVHASHPTRARARVPARLLVGLATRASRPRGGSPSPRARANKGRLLLCFRCIELPLLAPALPPPGSNHVVSPTTP